MNVVDENFDHGRGGHRARQDHLVYDHNMDPEDVSGMTADEARKAHARDHLEVISQEEWDRGNRRWGLDPSPVRSWESDHSHGNDGW